MAELIALIFLVLGLFGMALILFRKIPVLSELPAAKQPEENLVSRVKNGIGNTPLIKSFSLELFLQKILSRFRILTLKIENKTAGWLQQLRERSIQRTKNFHEGYWRKLKDIKKKESKSSR